MLSRLIRKDVSSLGHGNRKQALLFLFLICCAAVLTAVNRGVKGDWNDMLGQARGVRAIYLAIPKRKPAQVWYTIGVGSSKIFPLFSPLISLVGTLRGSCIDYLMHFLLGWQQSQPNSKTFLQSRGLSNGSKSVSKEARVCTEGLWDIST